MKLRVHFPKNEDYQYFMLKDPPPSGAEVINDWAFKIEGKNDYAG
ncbi:MAG: hypothetical protein R3A12_06780 [Ignavibacteria bacterium]